MSSSTLRTVRRRRQAGDSPATCMLIIAGILVACALGYRYFWYDRALERAITAQDVAVSTSNDRDAYLSYRRRIRDKVNPMVKRLVEDGRKACMPVIRDKVKDVEETKSALNKCMEAQRSYIEEINSQTTPKDYEELHKSLAMSVGNIWKACNLCDKAMDITEPAEKKATLKEADRYLKNARKYQRRAQEIVVKKIEG